MRYAIKYHFYINMDKKGFSPIVILLVVAALVIGGVWYYYATHSSIPGSSSKVTVAQNIIATSTAPFTFLSVKSDDILQMGTTYQIQWTPCIDSSQNSLGLTLWVNQDTGGGYDTGVDLSRATCDAMSHVETIPWQATDPFTPHSDKPYKSQFAIDESVGAGDDQSDVSIATSSWFYIASPLVAGEATGTSVNLENINVDLSGSSSVPFSFRPGDTINISWIDTVGTGIGNEHFDITLEQLGVEGLSSSTSYLIASNITQGGAVGSPPYQWVIPQNLNLPTGGYKIRIDQYVYPECQAQNTCNHYTQYRQYTDGESVYVKAFRESYSGVSRAFEIVPQ
jgi:hypothetical protein